MLFKKKRTEESYAFDEEMTKYFSYEGSKMWNSHWCRLCGCLVINERVMDHLEFLHHEEYLKALPIFNTWLYSKEKKK